MTEALTIPEMEEKCLWVRRTILEMAVRTNSGHVSTGMSQTEILVALYYGGILKHDPADPNWEGRDFFIQSKGQGGIGLYPILADRGYFPKEELVKFCGEGAHIGVHAEWSCPGVETISGSLGHGLSIGTGIAQSLKTDGQDNLVFVLTGDGELHEGSNWEAMFTANWQGLNNLVVIVDNNDQATLGHLDDKKSAKDGPGLDSLEEKFLAFGFHPISINGHNLGQVLWALNLARDTSRATPHKPLAIIAHTKKGKGLSCMEDKRLWHYRVPYGKDLDQCWEDLGVPEDKRIKNPPTHTIHGVGAMRDNFFDTLEKRFEENKHFVLITADNGFPTIERWAEKFGPTGQFFQVGIAEQQMVGMASGMALRGKKVFCYAIAPFVTTRVHEFVKLDVCAAKLPICMIGVGAGYAYSIMGPTHHTAEDIAIMRSLPNLDIWSPADGKTAEAVANAVCDSPNPSYVRLDRGGLPELGNSSEIDTEYGLEVVKAEAGDSMIILSTGVMTHQALKVAEKLGNCCVIDVFRLKPLCPDYLLGLIHNDINYVVTLEEHRLPGGLGSIVAEIFADEEVLQPLLRLGAEDRFVFELGGREVIWKQMGLDVDSIVKRIKEWQTLAVPCEVA